jgi:hypothetical protein
VWQLFIGSRLDFGSQVWRERHEREGRSGLILIGKGVRGLVNHLQCRGCEGLDTTACATRSFTHTAFESGGQGLEESS